MSVNHTSEIKHVTQFRPGTRDVSLLWALPTPHTILAARLNSFIQLTIEMNHKHCHSKFQNWN